MQWRSARSRWRSRRSRRRGVVRARRRGDLGTVAAGTTVNGGERARAEGNGGEREGDLAGEKAQRPRESGGEWERGPRERGAAGALILSRGSPPARGFGGDAPLFRPGRGNRKGTRGGGVGWAGARLRVAAQLGPGGFGPRFHWGGGAGLFPFAFFFCFVFCFLFFVYFI